MPGSPTIVQFQGQTPPWSLISLDANFTNIKAILREVSSFSTWGQDAGAANAYAFTYDATLTFALSGKPLVIFKAANANTGASTLNVNATGVKNIVNADGSLLRAGQIPAGGTVAVVYDGTNYVYLGGQSNAVPRGYLSGLVMSTAGGSATMTTAAGVAADSTGVGTITLPSAIGKTTSAWAVGSGNGGLDTGAIANSTWYHFYAIMRPDTGVCDVLISLAAVTPTTMPANYTLYRRIGSGKTNGAAQWTSFIQDGDYFRWLASVNDLNVNNPGAAAVTRTLTVPTGVNVHAMFNAYLQSLTVGSRAYFSDLAANDEAVAATAPTGQVGDATNTASIAGGLLIRTNTSAQIRSRLSASDANTTLILSTLGWIDRRGRDS